MVLHCKHDKDLTTVKYIIPGDPIPWQRVGKNGARSYDKQKTQKMVWGLHFNKQFNLPPFSGPIRVDMVFRIRVFKSLAQKYGKDIEGWPCYAKPDGDNLAKFTFDALNTIAWVDDCIIAKVDYEKVWSYDPCTEIIITPLRDFIVLPEIKNPSRKRGSNPTSL